MGGKSKGPCKFGYGCTRVGCWFEHPPGHVPGGNGGDIGKGPVSQCYTEPGSFLVHYSTVLYYVLTIVRTQLNQKCGLVGIVESRNPSTTPLGT